MSHITKLSQPLRKLLTKNHIYTWGPSEAKAFLNISMFSPGMTPMLRPGISRCSAYGLGAILVYNNHDQQWKLVAYASRSLTETRYAQIEKKGLVATWAANISLRTYPFSFYIIAKNTSHIIHSSYFSVHTLSTFPLCRDQAATIVT